MKRKSVKPIYSMVIQPAFIIGTNNEDGTCNFAPITWVSVKYHSIGEFLGSWIVFLISAIVAFFNDSLGGLILIGYSVLKFLGV